MGLTFNYEPYVRYVAKSTYFIDVTVVAMDCRMIYVISGEGSFESGEQTYPLRGGTLLYYPHGIPYRIRSSNGASLLFYTVNFDFTSEFKHISTLTPQVWQSGQDYELICIPKEEIKSVFGKILCFSNAVWAESFIDSIYKETLARKDGYSELQSSMLKALLISIYRSSKAETESAVIRKIKQLVKNNPKSKNKDIAKLMNYHPFYVNDLFRNSEGITLHQYIVQVRLAMAYEMIASSDSSLNEIAELCGFSSQSHLSNAFRTAYGITPSQLRKQV